MTTRCFVVRKAICLFCMSQKPKFDGGVTGTNLDVWHRLIGFGRFQVIVVRTATLTSAQHAAVVHAKTFRDMFVVMA